jgi:hypothetical protein
MRTLSKTVAVAALAATLIVPAGALARGGGGGFHGGFHGAIHVGPVFGFPRPAVHHGLAHGFARRWPARFAWRFHQWKFHHNNGANTGYGYGGDAGSYGGTYYPSDVTGTAAGPGATVFAPPAPAPSERVGCQSRSYDVPSEGGGVVKVSVTRC